MTEPYRIEAVTSDGLVFDGHRFDPEGSPVGVVLFVHGMAAAPLANDWTRPLAATVTSCGWAFAAVSHRGTHVLRLVGTTADRSRPATVGAAVELLADAPGDIAAWLGACPESQVVLCGHSLGANKVVQALASSRDPRVQAALLLAPCDLVRYTQGLPGFGPMVARAERLVSAGRPRGLIAGPDMPIAAATLLERAFRGARADVIDAESVVAARSELADAQVPMHVVMGECDDDLGPDTHAGLAALRRQNPRLTTRCIPGADHEFSGHHAELLAEARDSLSVLGGDPPGR